ncbi:uncharacterized protein LOC109144281 [Corvus cornix cornix]|uniref:uncharacterized protein LOC109144281 n=1 Tax=Corvus cornix cornix TaxID=932674 RepID=UPI00194FAA76|nr:uncharacterized protein LOC109144281 [Corvus cornix cornix]
MRCLRLESPLCANDSSCPAELKCCPWECRLRCIPPAEEKPGACPAAAPERLIAPCSFPCLEDKDCLGAQKCCRWAAALPAWSRRRVRTRRGGWEIWLAPGTLCAIVVSLTPWPLGQHRQLPLLRQLLAAAGKTQRWDVAAGTRNLWVMAGARDPRRRQGGQWGMLNRHTHSALPDQPKPSEGPTVQPRPVRERCRGDGDCPDAQKCCNSSCGHQCLPEVPAGEAGWDRMGSAGGDMAQRPGMMPWGSSHHGTELWHKRDAPPHACQGGSAGPGVGTNCTAPRWAPEWGGKGTVRPPSGEATILLSSCSTVQRTPALPRPLNGHCCTSGDVSRTRTVPHPTSAVTSCAAGTVWQTVKVRGPGATPKIRQPHVPWSPRLRLQAVALQPLHTMPAGKDGFCPVRAGLFPSYDCRAQCWHDGECPREEKCCLSGCDYVCLPPSREKPGICPLAEEAPLAVTPCGTTCTKDWQCPGAEKCCSSSRCGHVCSAPEPDKPSECPKVRPQRTSEPCTEMDSCTHDRDCSRQEKCCFSGCAMRCTRPARGERGSPATSPGK